MSLISRCLILTLASLTFSASLQAAEFSSSTYDVYYRFHSDGVTPWKYKLKSQESGYPSYHIEVTPDGGSYKFDSVAGGATIVSADTQIQALYGDFSSEAGLEIFLPGMNAMSNSLILRMDGGTPTPVLVSEYLDADHSLSSGLSLELIDEDCDGFVEVHVTGQSSNCSTPPDEEPQGETDTDGDGLSDDYELANNMDPNDDSDGLADIDEDGFTFAQEVLNGSDANDLLSIPAQTTVTPIISTVDASSDDAEEKLSGAGTGNMDTGGRLRIDDSRASAFRFSLALDQGVQINSAKLQFTADDDNSSSLTAQFQVEDIDDSSTYSNSDNDITNRNYLAGSVSWQPPAWNNEDDAGPDQLSPDISNLLQVILDKPSWNSGNHVSVKITADDDQRKIKEGLTQLIVEYSDSLVPYWYLDLDNDGLENYLDDDDDGDELSDIYELANGLDPHDSSDGLSDTDNDGFSLTQELQNSSDPEDPLSIPNAGIGTIVALIADDDDDAEEWLGGGSDGNMNLGGTIHINDHRTSAFRFSIPLDKGTVIDSAKIQFTADDDDSTSMDVTIGVEDNDNTAIYTNSDYDISSRMYIPGTVLWQPNSWGNNDSGADQLTTDFSSLLQIVVDKDGWLNGNYASIIFTADDNARWVEDGTAQLIIDTPQLSPAYYVDTDGDGIQNYLDSDDDNDGVSDIDDLCLESPANETADATGCTPSQLGGSLPIIDLVFSDANFELCVTAAAAKNSWVVTSELKQLSCEYAGLTSLSGIEELTYLEQLDLSNNPLINIDLLPLVSLKRLVLWNTQISSLDLSNNVLLTVLDVHGNTLSALDLNANTELKLLSAGNNLLTTIDVEANTQLLMLDIRNNPLDTQAKSYLTSINGRSGLSISFKQ